MRKTKEVKITQDALFPQAVPRDTSRFSIARIAFTLRRGKETIKAILTRDRSRGHTLRTDQQISEQKASASSSSLFWNEGDEKRVVASAELPGEVTMTTEGQSVIFTSPTGAILKYHSSGAFLYSPAPLRREQKAQEESAIPWYHRSAEAVGKEGIRIEHILVRLMDAPRRTDTARGVPVVRFSVALVDAPDVQLPVDVYDEKKGPRTNRTRIAQVLNKKLQPGDEVLLTGHFHVDRLTGETEHTAKQRERRWVRLLHLDPKDQASAPPQK